MKTAKTETTKAPHDIPFLVEAKGVQQALRTMERIYDDGAFHTGLMPCQFLLSEFVENCGSDADRARALVALAPVAESAYVHWRDSAERRVILDRDKREQEKRERRKKPAKRGKR